MNRVYLYFSGGLQERILCMLPKIPRGFDIAPIDFWWVELWILFQISSMSAENLDPRRGQKEGYLKFRVFLNIDFLN